MGSRYIAPIVEGHGEIQAVPELLRRISSELLHVGVEVNFPYRVKALSFLKFERDFEKAIMIASSKASEYGGFVLIILDCEDGCPAELGPMIRKNAKDVRSDIEYIVVLAYREFETWFLYSAKSLSGSYGLPQNLETPQDPESHRDAKGWFGNQMPNGYKETTHQVAFTARFDLQTAHQSRSFSRFVERLKIALM